MGEGAEDKQSKKFTHAEGEVCQNYSMLIVRLQALDNPGILINNTTFL